MPIFSSDSAMRKRFTLKWKEIEDESFSLKQKSCAPKSPFARGSIQSTFFNFIFKLHGEKMWDDTKKVRKILLIWTDGHVEIVVFDEKSSRKTAFSFFILVTLQRLNQERTRCQNGHISTKSGLGRFFPDFTGFPRKNPGKAWFIRI